MMSSGVPRRPPMQQKELSQHDEIIKFIHEAWNKVYITVLLLVF